MNLPFTVPSKSHPRPFYYSLEIGEGVLQTSIWTVENSKVQVLSCGTFEKYLHSSDFITAADRSLTQSAMVLKIDPVAVKKVILGLPASWLAQEKILPEKSRFLKEICHKLSLKPIGFVVTAEAVVKFLHTTEGVPPTAILVGISGDGLEVTVVRLGKIVGVHSVKRGNNISDDVKEGLSRFLPADLFPSRILLYDHGVELETLRQTLLSFPWQAPQNHLPFLHFPKIDILPSDFSIRAVSITAGSEAVSLQLPSPEDSVEQSAPETVESPVIDLGFYEDIDVAEKQNQSRHQIRTPEKSNKPINKSHRRLPVFSLPALPALPAIPALRIFLMLLIVLVVVSLPVFYWYRFVSVKIILSFVPQTVSDRFNANLLLTPVSAEAESQVTVPATGQVLVGDKATGTVTVINGTNVVKTFSTGTELTSDSGLKFITAESVTVASASGTADPNSYQPGKTDVKVTASAIGTDSNLSAGSEFKIGSFSKLDYVARNSVAFSGGSSRQAQAVAKKDLADAKAQADTDLASKSQTLLANSIPEGSILVPSTIIQKVVSESADHKEGEAADQVIYTKKIKAEGKTYLQSDLDRLVDEKLSPQYPANFKLLSSPKTEVAFSSNQANISASVDLAPDLDTASMIPSLLGQPTRTIDSHFRNLPGLSKVSIVFQPQKGDFFHRLPFRKENLMIFTSFGSE